jgi:hypothetical protein
MAASAARTAAIRRSENRRPSRPIPRVRASRQFGCGIFCTLSWIPPQEAWDEVRDDRRRRVVGVSDDDLVAELSEQHAGFVDRRGLRLSEAGEKWWRNLGTQGDPQAPRGAGRCGDEAARGCGQDRCGIEEQRRVLHRPADWPEFGEAGPHVVVRGCRDPVALWLDAEQATPGCRDADGAAGVGAQRDRCEPGSHSGDGPAAATGKGPDA